MPRVVLFCLFAFALASASALGQYGYGLDGKIPGSDIPAGTFQGKLRAITKKDLTIDVADTADQTLTFHITHKTKFIRNGKQIKPGDVQPGTFVAIDAERDPDQKFSALNVIINPPKPKPADQ